MNENHVDQNEIKLMQSCVMLVLSIGFVIDSWQIIALQSTIFLLTIINPEFNPFIALYRTLLRPLNIIKGDWRMDNMPAHRFASMIGLTISVASVVLLNTGNDIWGWSLVGLILAFGILALSGWCAGCYSYYMINKLVGKGFFKHSPIDQSFPGTRPPKG